MKLHELKHLACKVVSAFCVLFMVCLFSAAVEGTLYWVVAALLGVVDLVVLNAICGALLPENKASVPSRRPVAPTLRVVQGGKAA